MKTNPMAINMKTNQLITLKHNGKIIANIVLTKGSGLYKNDFDLTITMDKNPAKETPGYYPVMEIKR